MKTRSEINVTPYIDILLVLLIIFMVIQPADQYDIETRVPDRPQPIEEPLRPKIKIIFDAIVISVDSQAKLRINDEPVTMAQLGTRLFQIYSARPNKNMFVRGAKDLPFAAVVKVIDVAKGAGVGDIGLVKETEIQPVSSPSTRGRRLRS